MVGDRILAEQLRKVMVGEEMAAMFTEPVRCDSFDLSVIVELGLAVCGEKSEKCTLEASKEPKNALHGV